MRFLSNKATVGAIGAIAGIVLTYLHLQSQSFVNLEFIGKDEEQFRFAATATGPVPIIIDNVKIGPGNVSGTMLEDVRIPQKQLSSFLELAVKGPITAGAWNGLFLGPGKTIDGTFSIAPQSQNFRVDDMTVEFKYSRTAHTKPLDILQSLTDLVGLTKGEFSACFYLCGNSGTEISCSYKDTPLRKIRKTLCQSDFMADTACCR